MKNPWRAALLLSIGLMSANNRNFAAESGGAASTAPTQLVCEGLAPGTIVETSTPRFSWRLISTDRAARQTACQLRVTELDASGKSTAAPVESPRIEIDQSQWVLLPGFSAKPKTRYAWQVRAWDERKRDLGWSEPAFFETGLMGAAWPAAWLTDGRDVLKDAAPAARYFRRGFEVTGKPVRAKLFLSAFGLVEPWLNGRKVTDDHFLPGWPDYRKRDFYVAYDITSQLQSGKNVLGLILGDGWYSGTLLRNFQFGPQPAVSAFLEIIDEQGRVSTVATDARWQWAEGPIRENGIYFGETFDARKDDANWSRAAESAAATWAWQPVKIAERPSVPLQARLSPPVRAIQELKPISRRQISPGVFQYDFGQNMVGWVRLKVHADAGKEVVVRHAEMLNADGTMHTANLRTAHATARYVARGGGEETWEPRFTFFGFRYIEVSGLDTPADDAVTGVVLHSDLARIGQFECSNPLLNKLYLNTIWGQKGNFLEVPTDCPQRNERLGWTGDAQVFSNTANYNMRAGAFYRQWLAALRDGFRDGEDGGYSDVAPNTGFKTGSAGWGDAGVIIPWVTWLHTGDRRMLEENFPTIQRWVDQQAEFSPDGIRRSKVSYGDWLAPGYAAAKAPTPYVLIATAYFARTTQIAENIAETLGDTATAQKDRELLAKIKAAFQKEFVDADGKVTSDEQTAYVLALGFDLVPAELRPKTIAHLEHAVAVKDNHLSTGFLGTPLLTPVLTQIGRADLAYAVVLQESYPGWLFSVKNGATTIWERWNSWTPEEGFNKDGMNSFNHYAYGSVIEWFYDTIAGLKPDAAAPGWKKFRVAPQPGGGLTFATASVDTPYGLVKSAWKIDGDTFVLEVSVPPNTEARVTLPTSKPDAATENGAPLSQLQQAARLEPTEKSVSFTLASGSYRFSAPLAK
jgi:alpha-L-rhamnosidase